MFIEHPRPSAGPSQGSGDGTGGPADQTASMAGASGGGGAQSFTDVHTSLAGHTAWLGARQLGSPWQAGVGLQPAFLLSQSVEQSTEPHCSSSTF